MITKEYYDYLCIRCPSLGGEVPFSYCRKQGEGKPCHRLPRCWVLKIKLDQYLKAFYSPEEIKQYFLQKHQGRMETFLLNLERINSMQNEQIKKEKLIKAIREASPEGQISCAKIFALADEHGISRKEMGDLVNDLKIKIRNCQLGCF